MDTCGKDMKTAEIYLMIDIIIAILGTMILIAAASPLIERIVIVMQGEPIGLVAGIMVVLAIIIVVCALVWMFAWEIRCRYRRRKYQETIQDIEYEIDTLIAFIDLIDEIDDMITHLDTTVQKIEKTI